MKFCKALQRVAGISDPEWAPFWTNYKMLKKLIKELLLPTSSQLSSTSSPAFVYAAPEPRDNLHENRHHYSPHRHHHHYNYPAVAANDTDAHYVHYDDNDNDDGGTTTTARPRPRDYTETAQQHRGDATSERTARAAPQRQQRQQQHDQPQQQQQPPEWHLLCSLGQSPGEVAFFRLLHSEFRKATRFFERAVSEFDIREERVRVGADILAAFPTTTGEDQWCVLAQSIYRLVKDLLLLETFCIMTVTSFSKILKKHDKVTGRDTRSAFMQNVVVPANFSLYPAVLAMLRRCEVLYDMVSDRQWQAGGIPPDGRLFLHMVQHLRDGEGGGDDGTNNNNNSNNNTSPAAAQEERGRRRRPHPASTTNE